MMVLACLSSGNSRADNKNGEKVKVACIGDSITYGFGIEDREHCSYPAQLQKRLGDGYQVANFGKSNMGLLFNGPLPYVKEPEYQAALDFKPDIAVIHLGVNDVDFRSWPCHRDEFIPNYLELIGNLRRANPACRILVARLTPIGAQNRRFETGSRDWLAEIQHAVEIVAKVADVQLVDFREPIYQYPALMPDQLHPSAEGYGILAKTVYEGITGDFGGLQMAPVYSSDMVLQHGQKWSVRGIADAGEKIRLSLKVTGKVGGAKIRQDQIVLSSGALLATGKGGDQEGQAVAGQDGRWAVELEPLRAGEVYRMTVVSKDRSYVYENVAAGEVWLCSGQSNMQFRLNEACTAAEDIPLAENALLRLYDMKPCSGVLEAEWSEETLDRVNHNLYFAPARWKACHSGNAAWFSAVGYYFGKMLQENLEIPVGLICNAIGGTTTESWVDRGSLEFHFPGILMDWWENEYVYDFIRNQARKNCQKAGTLCQRHPYQPYYSYDAGIRPIRDFAIRGVIWYQGESNVKNYLTHEKLFHLLVEGWRRDFSNPKMPFYFVQLSGMDRPAWPWFRDSQRRLAEEMEYVGMAVSSDYGDSLDVHPKNKRPIGQRLARLALNKTYGLEKVVPCGPMFSGVCFEKGQAYVSFQYGEGMKSSDGKAISGFEVAGEDEIFYPAHAEVVAQKERSGVATDMNISRQMRVWSEKVERPVLVRYAWQPFTRANLVNGEGLPASTFSSCRQGENEL